MVLHEFVRDRNLEPEVANTLKHWQDMEGYHYNDAKSLEEKRNATIRLAMNFNNRGWRTLGRGVFGLVLEKKDSDFVIKVSPHNDIGFNKFVLITHKYNNPHFPKITNVRRIQYEGRTFFIYLIEKLYPVPYHYLTDNVMIALGNIAAGYESFDDALNSSRVTGLPGLREKLTEYFKAFPKLVEAAEIIKNSGVNIAQSKKHRIDMHNGNFMRRADGTLVITDPLCTDIFDSIENFS